MKYLACLFLALCFASSARSDNVKRDLPYADPTDKLQTLDVYAPDNAKNLPVVFWIHGGGWQGGEKESVQSKPKAFVERGFVFVSTNYRLLPKVDMESIIHDVAKSIHWVHEHISEFGGDPNRVFVMGHSAGAQLAAIICTDESYLKAEGLTLGFIKGCVPVDGDTYDIPMMIEAGAKRRKALGQPDPKFGHYEKFGSDPEKHKNFSAVNHVGRDKGIPPFLLIYVVDHPDTSAQAKRLANVLEESSIPVKLFGAEKSEHSKINENLGLPDDPSTKILFAFVDEMAKK